MPKQGKGLVRWSPPLAVDPADPCRVIDAQGRLVAHTLSAAFSHADCEAHAAALVRRTNAY